MYITVNGDHSWHLDRKKLGSRKHLEYRTRVVTLPYEVRVRISALLPVIYQSFRLPSASNVARAISWSTVCPTLSCTICFANSLTCGSVLIWEMRISFQIQLDKGNRGGESKRVGLGFRCLKLNQLKDREGLYEDLIWSTLNLNTQVFYQDGQYAHVVIVPY